MKKKIFAKKAASLVMASAMTLSLTMFTPFSAFADDEVDVIAEPVNDGAGTAGTDSDTVVPKTVTIQQSGGSAVTEEGRYWAYQIFVGTIPEGTNYLTNFKWGSSLDYGEGADDNIKKLLAALGNTSFGDTDDAIKGKFKAISDGYAAGTITKESTASQVSKILDDFGTDAKELFIFAGVVKQYVKESDAKKSDSQGKFSLVDGYYLIVDTDTENADGDAISPFMLKLTDDTTVTIKAETPTVEKAITKVTSPDGTPSDMKGNVKTPDGNTATAAVGDTVSFKLEGTLPAKLSTYYDFYYYQFYDNLDDGFTVNPDSIKVYIDLGATNWSKVTGLTVATNISNNAFLLYDRTRNGNFGSFGLETPQDATAATKGKGNFSAGYFDTAYTTGEDDKLALKDANLVVVTFSDLLEAFETAMQDGHALAGLSDSNIIWSDIKIVVEYDAVLNENANIGTTPNDNTVRLVYSNDPNVRKNGNSDFDPEEETPPPPDPDEPNGDGPDDPDNPNYKKRKKRYPDDPNNPPPPYDPDEPWTPGDDPDEPWEPNDPDDPSKKKNRHKHKTKTPEETVHVYTFAIDIFKTNVLSPDEKLSGAKFQITSGTDTNKKTAVLYPQTNAETNKTEYIFVGWVNLANDSDLSAFKANTTALKKILGEDCNAKLADLTTEAVSDEDGKLIVQGLAEGTYTVTETGAPDGFTVLQNSFTVKLEAATQETASDDLEIGDYNGKLVAGSLGETTTAVIFNDKTNGDTDGIADITVLDNPMSILPDTGGNGIYFYYGGGVAFLLMGVAALTISKKKFGTNRMV